MGDRRTDDVRSDVSVMEDSRDEASRDVAASTATSRPAVLPWELSDARRVLREWSLARLLATRPAAEPIVFNADTPIGEALRRMAEAGILSAPVLDAVDGQPATDFLGFIDVSDVVTSLLKELYPWLLDEPHRSTARGMMAALQADTQSVTEVMKEWARELFLLRWVRTVRPGADGDFLYHGLGYKTLLDVISRGLQNLPVGMRPWGDLKPSHRIAVFDLQETRLPAGTSAPLVGVPETVKITDVVSQTDLVAFLLFQAQEGHLGQALPARTVESLGWVRRDVVTVPAAMPTIAAFALMLNRGVSGAGVVAGDALESDAPLISSLSISDIRVLHRASDFDALALPVADFLLYQYGSTPPDAEAADAAMHAATSAASSAAAPPAAPGAQGGAAGPPAEVAVATQAAAMEMSAAAAEERRVEAAAQVSMVAGGVALPTAGALEAAMEEPQPPQPRLWLVSCTPQSTLLEVLEKMVFNSVHRVYIVDEQKLPLGVVTMSDVLQLVAVDPQNDPEGLLETAMVSY